MLRNNSKPLIIILLASITLNLWGIDWGLPERWHPDEITGGALTMGYFKSLNHHHFAYGALSYYQVMILVTPIYLLTALMDISDFDQQLHILWFSSRVLSALLGSAIVLITFLLTKVLFDRKAALVAASLLTVSMGFVNLAHFATTDIPSIFWFSLSCLMSAYIFTNNKKNWYLLAGLFVGFAAAVKYIGVIALITLIVAHFLSGKKRHRNLVYGVLMVLIGFLVANPVAIFSFCEFSEGFLKESLFNSFRNLDGPYAFLPFISRLREALGFPLFFLSIFGLLYSAFLLNSKKHSLRVLLIWSMVFPYYFIMGSMHVDNFRYIVHIVPFLLILTGKMMSDFIVFKYRLIQIVSYILFAIIIGYSLLFTVAADLAFTYDSRKLAKDWIIRNIPDGTKIEVTSYFTRLPKDKYNVIRRPHENKVEKTALLTINSKKYIFSKRIISQIQFLAEKFKLCNGERPYYITWYEKALIRYNFRSSNFDLSVEGLKSRGPDYLIVSSNYFNRFSVDKASVEGQFFNSLFKDETEYKKVAEFKYRFHPLIDPKPEFVNPLILVYKRVKIN